MTKAKINKFIELENTGKRQSLKMEILYIIKLSKKITIDELCIATGKKNGTVGGRISDLLDDGLIKENGQKENGQSYFVVSKSEEIYKLGKERKKAKDIRCINLLLKSNNLSKQAKMVLKNDIDNIIDNDEVVLTALNIIIKAHKIKRNIRYNLIDEMMKINGVKNTLSEEDKIELLS